MSSQDMRHAEILSDTGAVGRSRASQLLPSARYTALIQFSTHYRKQSARWPVRQGGKLQIGAPHGNWQMVVVYRGKHDPVRPII